MTTECNDCWRSHSRQFFFIKQGIDQPFLNNHRINNTITGNLYLSNLANILITVVCIGLKDFGFPFHTVGCPERMEPVFYTIFYLEALSSLLLSRTPYIYLNHDSPPPQTQRFVQDGSNQTELEFSVPAHSCGSERVYTEQQAETLENILIIQNDPLYQEEWDLARLIACRQQLNVLPDLMQRRVVFRPYLIDNLEVISVSSPFSRLIDTSESNLRSSV